MTLDLDALEAQINAVSMPVGNFGNPLIAVVRKDEVLAIVRNALPELIRLARIGQRTERDAKEHCEPRVK